METLQKFVEAKLDYTSAEADFKEELCDILKLEPSNIHSILVKNRVDGSKIIQVIHIELIGQNHFQSKDLCKIEGLTLITPKYLEIEVGEIHL